MDLKKLSPLLTGIGTILLGGGLYFTQFIGHSTIGAGLATGIGGLLLKLSQGANGSDPSAGV